MSPRDPQGAETRTTWQNVYLVRGKEYRTGNSFATRELADERAEAVIETGVDSPRIAIEEVTTTTTITRIPCAGEEQ